MPAAIAWLVEFIGEEALLSIAAFTVLVGYMASRGMLAGWNYTLGAALRGIASLLDVSINLGIKTVHLNLGGPFKAADTFVQRRFQDWCRGTEIELAWTWRRMVGAYKAQVGAIEWASRELDHSMDWLLKIHFPRWTKYLLGAPALALLIPKLVKALIPHIHSVVVKPVKVIERTLPGKTLTIVKHQGAAALEGALGIPGIRADIHGLTKRWARINARLRKVEGLLGVTALAAAMANVFGLPNWRCLTRGNVGRTVRHLCGLGPRALEDLLSLLVDLFVFQYICEAVTLMESAFNVVVPDIAKFIATAEEQFVHCGYNLPANHTVADPDLPPVTGLTLSLA